MKKIAAIDIGSNAIRMLICFVIPSGDKYIFQKNLYLRLPIRLGEDSFKSGIISNSKINLLTNAILSFKYIMKVHEVEDYQIYATSALRESSNSKEVISIVKEKTDLKIELITGLKEATIISKGNSLEKIGFNKTFLYVDVGGGSTEIYIFENNQHIIQSFQLGAVRGMLAKDDPQEWLRLKKWLKKQPKINTLVGLGGNIRSFLNLNNKKKMNSQNFIDLTLNIKKLDVDSKISKYGLQKDRADVIDFALIIYAEIIKLLEVKEIKSTKWGVSDSIAVKTFHELYSKKISISRN